MKKILLIICGLLIITFSGCINRAKLIGSLATIQVFNEDGSELVGEYIDKWREPELFPALNLKQFGQEKLNSPAPRLYFYCVEALEGANYTIRFTIICKNNYTFASIVTSKGTFDTENSLYTIEGNRVILDIPVLDVDFSDPFIYIENILFTKEVNGTVKYYQGSRNVSENTIEVSGIYFYTRANITT